MQFKKTILRPGTYHSPRGLLEVTTDRLKHWVDQFKAMIAAGHGIPGVWNHSADPSKMVPLSLNKPLGDAQNVTAWMTSLDLAPDGQGLNITLDVPRPEDAEKAKTNLARISPVIFKDWKDGSGKVWSDVITHVDLVGQPVDHKQTPFVEAIACSLAHGDDDNAPEFFTLAADEEAADPPVTAPKEEPNPDLPGPNKSEDDRRLEAILAHLAEEGIVLESDTDASNFLERLLSSLMTAKATKEQQEAEKVEPEHTDDDPLSGATKSDPAFAAMSLELTAVKSQLEREAREKRTAKIAGLLKAGRITPTQAKQLEAQASVYTLSMDTATGQMGEGELDRMLAFAEQGEDGRYFSTESQLQTLSTEQPPPKGLLGEGPTDEEADATVDSMYRKPAKQTA